MVLSISDQVFLFPAKRLRTFDFELFYYFGLSTSDEIKREKSKVTTSDLFYHFDPTSIFRTIDFGPEFFGSKCIITSNQLFSTSDSLFIDFGLHTSTSDFTTSTPTQVRSRCCPKSQTSLGQTSERFDRLIKKLDKKIDFLSGRSKGVCKWGGMKVAGHCSWSANQFRPRNQKPADSAFQRDKLWAILGHFVFVLQL